MNMKNNLFQNFYIVGLSMEDFIQISKKEDPKNIFQSNNEVELSPKIITKFPPNDYNHNSIPDQIIIDHCFPNGFKMVKTQKSDSNNNTHFCFELDNLKYSYLSDKKTLYSKIYCTCLKFNESLQDYQKLKLEMDKKNIKNESEINISNNINEANTFYIPKVLCFASLLPFTKETIKILNNLYEYFLYYNNNVNTNNIIINNLSPFEKIIEQLVMCLPFPISMKNEYCISYKFNYPINSINSSSTVNTSSASINNLKNNLGANNFPYNNTNIVFPIYDPLNCFMNDILSISLSHIFLYFNEEEVVKIFKYIILEIPILFFSESNELLSQIIQGFLSLLQPFNYVLPHVTILPSKYYGLINMETSFIFGIGENYTVDFFKNNNILLDKSIIIINLLKGKKAKIEEVKKIEDQKDYVIIDNYNIYNYINNESILPNGAKIDKINIDFPNKIKKKLISRIKSYLNESRKKKDSNYSGEYGHVFNQKIRNLFYRFFTNILSGYSDYLLKINNYNINKNDITGYYSGDNIRYKINYNCNNSNANSNNNYNNEIIFIKSIFNMDEFISKFPKDNHMFYRIFCNTKLFQNFIREIIFSNDEQVLMNHKYFDLITYLKKHKDLKKQNKFKELLLKYKNLFNKKNDKKEEKLEPKIFLNISNDSNYNLDEKNIISKKQNDALMAYGQLINISNQNSQNTNNIFNQQITLKYFIFPKIFFDNNFFDISYDRLFFRHYLDMPNFSQIKNLYTELKILNRYYLDKYKEILLPKSQNESNNSTKTLIDLRRSSNMNYINNNNGVNINTNPNLEVLVDNYIEYNWLLLISCSLWYCFNQVETEIRINKIFDVLEKIDFIEEQVLFILYISIYNFGNKSQLIKMFEFLYRFMGYSPYINLIYLCLKLNQKEDNSNNNMKDKDKIEFKRRSFFDINKLKSNIIIEKNNEIKDNDNKANEIIEDACSNINQKEEIVFYTMQICSKCKKENKNINISDMIHHRISQKRNNLCYKCIECGEENANIKIKYTLSLNNKKKNSSILITQGQFKLIPPHIIYQEIKEKILYLKDYKLDIDHIFSNDNIYLLSNIYYFSDRLLPFDFLIPYEGQEDRDYLDDEEEEESEEEENNMNIINNAEDKNNGKNKNINGKFKIYSINSNSFSLIEKE